MMKQATLNGLLTLVLLALPFVTGAQVPVDEQGNVVGDYQTESHVSAPRATGNEDIPLLTPVELEELVGPIALYPDDLLAIVLPAAAYPLQIVEAARFLEELEDDPTLKPDTEWDESVVALLNYPEIVALLNDEIDWTWQLGEAVVAQQADVVAAIESFRDRAYAAGNLKTDEYQTVSRNNGVIEITPVAEDVIYVPYYEPERVVVYQPRPVYYYYPRAYPVYYYPYASWHVFDRGFFWGVTTAFTIGWVTDSLHVYHHSYYGHPYYGRSYWDYWWYRRPSITVYNTTYVQNRNVTINHYYTGDRWQPRHDRRRPARPTEPRVMNRHYYDGANRSRPVGITRSVDTREPIQFRERSAQSRTSTRHQLVERVRDSRERIGRQGDDHRNAVANSVREPRVNDRVTAQRTPRVVSRPANQRTLRRESPPVAQRESRLESYSAARREVHQESRPTAQRQTARRESRPAPQRQAARPESRPAPRRQSAARESRPAPERQVRQESRPSAKQSESRRSGSSERRERSKERRSAR
jgi:hypothetical protein